MDQPLFIGRDELLQGLVNTVIDTVESQLPFASHGDYCGRKRLPGKIPEKLNKERQLRR